MELGKVNLKTFSNGEQYVRYEESVRGKDVFIVQTGTESCDSDILEACLMCQAAKLGFAKSIRLVIPHFPYARQDRVSEPREPISAKLIADLLVASGADHVPAGGIGSSSHRTWVPPRWPTPMPMRLAPRP